MSKGPRIALLIATVAVVVVVFLLVRPSDEGPAPTTSAGGATTSTEASPGEEKPQPKPEPKPTITRIDVVEGQPKGGVAKIEVETGEAIEFTVASDVPEEIHVHGFDLYEDVGPGQKAAFDFPADLEGIFEVELHGSAVQIAELRVNP